MDYKRIYQERARDYDQMVAAEDCDGNLLPALESIVPLRDARVIEVGVGTGRVTRLLCKAGAAWLLGVEESPHMLEIAQQHLEREAVPGHGCDWHLVRGDMAAIPAPDSACDVAIAGWVYGHMTEWFKADWRSLIDSALAELVRVTRAGGTQIIIETLGTGAEQPAPPTQSLFDFYDHLEKTHGFTRRVVSTDYGFATAEEAALACGFFFGDDFARMILDKNWAKVPEWTGIWWRTLPG